MSYIKLEKPRLQNADSNLYTIIILILKRKNYGIYQ